MNNYVEMEKRLGSRKYFPNVSEEAYFAPQSQTIHLRKITDESFRDAIKRNDMPKLRQQLGTMLHEITHWADLVGTLWGRNYIETVYSNFRLLSDINIPGKETEFYRFIELHDQTRRMMMGRYYRVVNSSSRPHDHRRPWRINLSAGREFDAGGRPNNSRPILFARFDDNSEEIQVARQPIVSGALLEINAVWSELRTNIESLNSMNVMDKLVEERRFSAERTSHLYHPELTLYTAPAHLLSMALRHKDVGETYDFASAVAHLVLNFRDDDFERMVLPSHMDAWRELFPGFIKSRDRGFAYAVICQSASKWIEGRAKEEWLDEALTRAGFGSAKSIYDAALQEMHSKKSPSRGDVTDNAEQYLLSLGSEILKLRARGDTALTPTRIAENFIPVAPMFDPDGNIIDLSNGRFDQKQFPLEQIHRREDQLFTWTQNFLEGCR